MSMSSAPPPPYATEKGMYYQDGPTPTVEPMYMGSPMVILGEYPVQCICPQCSRHIVTRTEKKAGLLAWIICAVLFFTLFWVCCFIPFCVDACKDTEHYCPNCTALLGASKRM